MNGNPAQPIVNAVNSAASGAVAAVNSAASGAAAAVNGIAQGAANAAAAIVNSVAKNVPSMNSLIPLGNNAGAAAAPANNGKRNGNAGAGAAPANNGKKNNAGLLNALTTSPDQAPNTNIMTNLMGAPAPSNTRNNGNAMFANSNTNANSVNIGAARNNVGNAASFANAGNAAAVAWASPLSIFIGLLTVFLVVFAVFNTQIRQGYAYISSAIKEALGIPSTPDVQASITPSMGAIQEVTVPPQPPQAVTPDQRELAVQQSIVEKVLPSPGGNEVFNVAQNKFTYYDAEPLCKALGAELATYEQVKEAWNKGADWCNYGWVKGQMAIYPTQKGTYDKLQVGPADEKNACGTVGINGGFFDNPELRYGVTCYGKKPSQSAHDEAKLMEEGKIPRSPETLKVDKLVAQFKTEADSLFVKPFSDDKWSTA